jgi:transposase InsO family protein
MSPLSQEGKLVLRASFAWASRWFGISRKTGYKIFDRYKDVPAGADRPQPPPLSAANQLPLVIETTIVRLKREYPHWGAPKIRERLRRRCPDVQCPAISTVHAVLDRHGLVTRRPRRRHRAEGTPLSRATQPNDLWCADYQGEFMLADRRYCYPLTITDFATHERMHLTLKREATKPAAANALQQQARFDDFLALFNHERPHQALEMRVPAELYVPSPRPYVGLTPLA